MRVYYLHSVAKYTSTIMFNKAFNFDSELSKVPNLSKDPRRQSSVQNVYPDSTGTIDFQTIFPTLNPVIRIPLPRFSRRYR